MIHPEEYPTNRRYLLDRVDDDMYISGGGGF